MIKKIIKALFGGRTTYTPDNAPRVSVRKASGDKLYCFEGIMIHKFVDRSEYGDGGYEIYLTDDRNLVTIDGYGTVTFENLENKLRNSAHDDVNWLVPFLTKEEMAITSSNIKVIKL